MVKIRTRICKHYFTQSLSLSFYFSTMPKANSKGPRAKNARGKLTQWQHQPTESNEHASTMTENAQDELIDLQRTLVEQQKQILELLTKQNNSLESQEANEVVMTAPDAEQTYDTLDHDALDHDIDLETSDQESANDSDGECMVTFAKPTSAVSGRPSVGTSVPLKLKKKIWKHKYIEFSSLLDPHSVSQSYTMPLGKSIAASKPTLNFTP